MRMFAALGSDGALKFFLSRLSASAVRMVGSVPLWMR